MPTGYSTDDRFALHNLPEHPENARRLDAVERGLRTDGLRDRLGFVAAQPVPDDLLLAAHTPGYLRRLDATTRDHSSMLGADTYVTPQSYAAARTAVGCVTAAIQGVLDGRLDNALAAVRPPGHHATPSQAMGFCLLNNIALGAQYARRTFGMERVLIVDYDVHHGNGTQDIFYGDPGVLFISTHQSPLYPGTGDVTETGSGTGQGATVNVPLPPGTGDRAYATVFERVVWPLAERFQPELLLVSAGFDAHWGDPLAQMQLSLAGYDYLNRELIRMAQAVCQGRIVFILEGGYNLNVLRYAWAGVARALLGDPIGDDILGPAPYSEPDIAPALARVRRAHQLG
ncbi:histone deacetylase family protein [Aggregatilinea lenta]|uniref:histone deacetylase family protein n=1 Tax=Aggregatilinea lenta TaxID=913108 RepID=UPI000E5BD5ED|nr:histone deacetylase [Aggregatilinea lenta]